MKRYRTMFLDEAAVSLQETEELKSVKFSNDDDSVLNYTEEESDAVVLSKSNVQDCSGQAVDLTNCAFEVPITVDIDMAKFDRRSATIDRNSAIKECSSASIDRRFATVDRSSVTFDLSSTTVDNSAVLESSSNIDDCNSADYKPVDNLTEDQDQGVDKDLIKYYNVEIIPCEAQIRRADAEEGEENVRHSTTRRAITKRGQCIDIEIPALNNDESDVNKKRDSIPKIVNATVATEIKSYNNVQRQSTGSIAQSDINEDSSSPILVSSSSLDLELDGSQTYHQFVEDMNAALSQISHERESYETDRTANGMGTSTPKKQIKRFREDPTLPLDDVDKLHTAKISHINSGGVSSFPTRRRKGSSCADSGGKRIFLD